MDFAIGRFAPTLLTDHAMLAVLQVLLSSVALVVVLIVISKRFSGWGDLHWHYGCKEGELNGKPLSRFCIVSLRMNRYLISTQVRIYPDGMWLAPSWLYFNFHPVLIPWSAIHFAGISWYGFGSTLFRVEGCDAALCFAGWRARQVEAAMRRVQEEQFVEAARLGMRREPFRVPTVF